MKSKRRHELQTNVLADHLGHWIDAIRPYATTIMLVALAVVVVVGAWYFWSSSNSKRVAESWRAYILASSNPSDGAIKDLKSVGDEFNDTQAGLWASQTAADIEGGQAVRTLFTAKATAQTDLSAARRGYEDVLENEEAEPEPMLKRRAHFGLAQVLEAEGSLDKAIAEYELVAADAPDSALGKAARRRADHLQEDSTRQWYAWFAKQTPAPPAKVDSNMFPGGLGQPGDPSSLPGGAGGAFSDAFGTGQLGDMTPEQPAESGTDNAAGDGQKQDASTGEDEDTAEGPTAEGPTVEGPTVEGPKVEGPKVEGSKVEGSKVEGSKVEGSKVEGSATEPAKKRAEAQEDSGEANEKE